MVRERRRTLLVSDLDGTLLRPDGTLSDTTTRVVNEFIAGGGMFTYATARSFTTASRVMEPLNLALPVITYGGAILVDPRTGEARPAQTLVPDAVDEVLRLTGGSHSVQPVLFAMHEGRDRVCWLADRVTPGVAAFLRSRAGDPRLFPLTTWSVIDPSSVFYISLISGRASVNDLYGDLVDARAGCHSVIMQDIYDPDQWWLELTAPSGTKAAAVLALKHELAADALVCFGDNHNDLPMLAIADTALAVANAVAEVRAAATDTIGANAEDGVASWIRDNASTLLS
jgi:5-amino-6-(5-phospho-D-ribitylamino)uracil phosphatase